MPHITVERAFPCDLSESLGVHPDIESHCIGFALSRGRRCRNPISAANRSHACSLLAEGTRRLAAGQSIDSQLDAIAPLLLCKKNHQGQASELTARWKREIRSFRQARTISLAENENGLEFGDETGLREQYEILSEYVSCTLDELNRIHRLLAQHSRATGPPPESTPNVPGEQVRLVTQSTDDEQRSTRLTESSGQNLRDTERESTLSIRSRPRSELEGERATGQHRQEGEMAQTERRRESVSPDRSQSNSARSNTNGTSSTRNPATPSGSTYQDTVTRRPIEGDCGICMSALQDDNSSHENLVWCRAQCGNNFHRGCLREWIDHRSEENLLPTCPFCRTLWQS
ncbi:hypothetical protein VTN00DRAFT_2902 [Thermoascus crustaceus]|uniref:uncharacterized protein n=1 Tax=Thermoascus crustaceus TaxID=5088 RepID=UPI003743B2C8